MRNSSPSPTRSADAARHLGLPFDVLGVNRGFGQVEVKLLQPADDLDGLGGGVAPVQVDENFDVRPKGLAQAAHLEVLPLVSDGGGSNCAAGKPLLVQRRAISTR